ncbi:Transporter of the ATP-binding cassette (ABC) [Polyrhizophydium stewartii]|uniref:Transporter of the ATP-binding cassette (ABC) n=1 Tax=Polyrhizophydium stewartii TaxID=2732419 RepID=A0ABR4NCB5_9FUNG
MAQTVSAAEAFPPVLGGAVLLGALAASVVVGVRDQRSRPGFVRLPDPDSDPDHGGDADLSGLDTAHDADAADAAVVGSATAGSAEEHAGTWRLLSETQQRADPPTLSEASLLAAAIAAALAAAGIGISSALGDSLRPLELVSSALWFAAWLCAVSLLLSSRSPRSSAPRSVLGISGPFVVAEAASIWAVVSDTPPGISVLPLRLHVAALAVGAAALAIDVCNPTRNAHAVRGLRINGRSVSGQDTASLWSLVTFSWIVPLLTAGSAKPLEAEDIPHISSYDHMSEVVKRWNKIRNPKNTVFWDLLRLTSKYAWFQMVCAAITATLGFSSPFFINRLLIWLQNRQPGEGWFWGVALLVGMFSSSLLCDILNSQIYLSGRHWGIQLRAVLVHEIFKKSLRRAGKSGKKVGSKPAGKGKGKGKGKQASEDDEDDDTASQGKIVSLMSNDTNSVRNFITDIHELLIDTPISIVISVSGLLYLMGPPALAGLFVIILSGPISGMALASRYKVLRQTRSLVDRRIQVTNEALQGIRIIKFMAWEPQFLKKILAAREDELNSRLKLMFNNLVMIFISWGSSILVTFTSFFFYTVVAGKTLDAATAFTSINLLSTVSFTLSNLSEDVSSILNIRVVLGRIQAFLSEEELERFEDEAVFKGRRSFVNRDPSLSIYTADFCHHSTADAMAAANAPAAVSPHASSQRSRRCIPGASWLLSRLRGRAASSASAVAVEDAGEQDNAHSFFLRGVSIDFPLGKLTSIIGPTGAGKTSLLAAILGELKRLSGEIHVRRQTPDAVQRGVSKSDIAYVAQTAWLLNATIRENIIFGEPFDQARYDRVIQACALSRDLELFPGGDLTEIGEKGVNLSGGQKQRVSLARAAYSRASIVLLDDPLSAVDAPTARHLFHECVLGLLRGRTILIVTHAVGLVVPLSDYVVAMGNGEVLVQGSPAAISEHPDIDSIVGFSLNSELMSYDSGGASSSSSGAEDSDKEARVAPKKKKEGKKITDREGKATGSVKLATYWVYLSACGGFIFLFLLFAGFFTQVMSDFLSNWWIQRWTDTLGHVGRNASLLLRASAADASGWLALDSDASADQGTLVVPSATESIASASLVSVAMAKVQDGVAAMAGSANGDALFYISVYGLISLIELFALIFKFVVQFRGGIRASRVMHSKLVEAVLGSPMRFFETTPVGRIINRFSKDMSDIDLGVMFTFSGFFTLTCGAVLRIGLVTFVTPPFLLALVFLYLYYRLARFYLLTSRELKRIDSVSSSPIYAKFSETLNGVSTIRAYGAEDRLTRQIQSKVDANHRAFFYLFATNRWLAFRTSVLSKTIILGAGLSIIFSDVSAGWAGVAFNFASQFTGMMGRIIQIHSSLEMAMNAVERVEEYSKLPQEPPAVIEEYRPPHDWPHEGRIDVDNVSVKYAPDLPEALRGITFRVNPREKLGIVGRTGAGKSTLSLAFFRILPFSSGTITIDGLDIGRMGLRDLRSRLTIIPQDPVLFEGTLGSNLDPLGEHDDAAIWEALQHTNLLDSLQKPAAQQGAQDRIVVEEDGDGSGGLAPARSGHERTPSGQVQNISLDTPVTENGGNFSQGQRQLLCLARALLRGRRLIFLDEATASVDADTDARIQETIRTQFRDATVLTVAHRLKTVIDYDRVLVMDAGQVAEIGSPYELIQKNGIFAGMCRESGDYEMLVETATQVHKRGLLVDV